MSVSEKQAEEILKTGAILGVVNTLAAPFYWFGAKVGLTVSAIANGATLYLMHEQGKDERVVGNSLNKVGTFFGEGKPIENGTKNITRGGATLYNEVKDGVEKIACKI